MATISPFKEGATIQVAQGVLRGVGPVGPRGYTGPAGPPGPQGPKGAQATFTPITASYSRSSALTLASGSAWQDVALVTAGYNLGEWTALNVDGSVRVNGVHPEGVAVVMTARVTVVPGGGASDTFRLELGLFNGPATTPFASNTYEHSNGTTTSAFTFSTQYLLPQGFTDVGIGVRIYGAAAPPVLSFTGFSISSTGGTPGGPGPAGGPGPIGPTGPTGPAGNANSGFTMFDVITQSGTDSDSDPGGATGTPIQGLPYPIGPQKPAIPYFFHALADAAAKRIVRRFADEAAMVAASDKEAGQIAFLSSNNSLRVMTSVGGSATPATIAQVTYGTTDPTGTYPAGTIYFKVT